MRLKRLYSEGKFSLLGLGYLFGIFLANYVVFFDIVIRVLVKFILIGLHMHALVEVLDGDMHFLDGIIVVKLGNFARMFYTGRVWLHF